MSEDRDFRSWHITPEQADKIVAGDKGEAEEFYTRNLKRFTKMAQNYMMRHPKGIYTVEEMVSQLFLDLSYLNWKNALTLTMSIKQTSFAWSAYGGYAQRFQAGQVHTGNPWNRFPDYESLDSPLFEEDEDGSSLLDRFAFIDEEESPEGILLTKEALKPLTVEQIVSRLGTILSPREAEFFELYLEGCNFTYISESLGLKDCSSLREQTFSKLTRYYKKVIDLVYIDRELSSELKGFIPDKYEEIHRKYDERIAKKRKGDKPKRVFASDAERQEAERASKREWYERNKERQNELRRARRQAEREARKARASV